MADDRQLATVLSEFAVTMVTDFAVQEILEGLVGRIVEMLPITGAGVTLISPLTAPEYLAASDDAALRYEELQTELGEGPCLAAYRSGEPVAVPDLAADTRFAVFGPRAVQAGLRAVFAFPLRQGDKRLGALDLYRGTVGALSADDMAAAQTLADVTAAYLVNAQAREELRIASERSYQSSVHDALTGLANRTLLLERIGHALLRGRRSSKISAVLFADLDRFKAVNDAHGHHTGDALLVAVAKRLSAVLRPGDTLARISGDEFVILCEDLEDEVGVERIASRIADALAVPFQLANEVVQISASVGIAFAGGSDQGPEHILVQADAAMYQAKRNGGARHQVLDLREHRQAGLRASLQRDLGPALDNGEFRIEYQPIVRTEDGRIVGAEALLRWDHPTRGLISPLMLIPLAEQAGLIANVGRYVLEQACHDWHRWSANNGCKSFGMAVNVSAYQLMGADFAATVAKALADTNTPPAALILEITEGALIQDSERASVVLHELKALEVMLALDDFGTGYSSLVHLNRFPVDVVKIDQVFTSQLQDRATSSLVGKVIELAHVLDLRVVVEGIETVEQRNQVAALGGECGQGFYFARPMPADHLDLLSAAAMPGAALRLPIPV